MHISFEMFFSNFSKSTGNRDLNTREQRYGVSIHLSFPINYSREVFRIDILSQVTARRELVTAYLIFSRVSSN